MRREVPMSASDLQVALVRRSVVRRSLIALAMLSMACSGGPSRPAADVDAHVPIDGARDAVVEAPDASPPDADTPGPLVPARVGNVTIVLGSGEGTFSAVIAIDAHEAGRGARAVIGANGETANVWLDPVGPGLLGADGPVDLRPRPFVSECRTSIVRLDDLVLRFDDLDGDGNVETLAQLRADVSRYTPEGIALMPMDTGMRVVLDTSPPTLQVWSSLPLRGDVFDLVASEPLDPASRRISKVAVGVWGWPGPPAASRRHAGSSRSHRSRQRTTCSARAAPRETSRATKASCRHSSSTSAFRLPSRTRGSRRAWSA